MPVRLTPQFHLITSLVLPLSADAAPLATDWLLTAMAAPREFSL